MPRRIGPPLTGVDVPANPTANGATNLFRRFGFGGTDWTAQLGSGEVLARVFPSETDAPAAPAGTVTVLAVQGSGAGAMTTPAGTPPHRVLPIEIGATRTGADGTHAAVMITIGPDALGFGPSALTGRLEHPRPGTTLLRCPNVTPGRYALHLGPALYEFVVEPITPR